MSDADYLHKPSDTTFSTATGSQGETGKPNSAVSLSYPARQRAVAFILENGTNLQRERYLFEFTDSSSRSNILAALSHYQNGDGGFGHGLEADLRTRRSSVIATTIAFQILESVNAPCTDMVKNATQYLISSYRYGTWQPINPDCNDAPHAPWWRYSGGDQSDEIFKPNPSVEVISHLITYNAMTSELPDLLDRAINHIKVNDLEMHDLLCYLRLYENPGLNPAYKEQLLPYLLSNGYQLIKIQEQDWEEYSLTPLSVINHQDSIYADFFADDLDKNIRHCIGRQNDDGSWSPTWSWGGEYPATWKAVEREIKVEITLSLLMQLQRLGRLETN